MIRWIFTLCLTFVTVTTNYAQVLDFPMAQSSLLWKISGDNVEGDSYLFGTMHLMQAEHFFFPKKLQKITRQSDLLVMELAGLPDPMETMPYLMLKEGSFFDLFNKQQTDSILSWAKESLQLEESAFRSGFSKMKPFIVVQLAIQVHFTGKIESYEKTFEEIATDKEIEIKGLETIAEQLSLFDNLTDEQQVEMVMETIREGDKGINLIHDMQNLYASQDIDSLYMLMTEGDGVISQKQNAFLDDRNQKWIPQIAEYINEHNTIIAVGAGHLGGPNGLVRLLEKEGYILTPIKL